MEGEGEGEEGATGAGRGEVEAGEAGEGGGLEMTGTRRPDGPVAMRRRVRVPEVAREGAEAEAEAVVEVEAEEAGCRRSCGP